MNSSQGENIIFLISQPRAGSTLLQLMLSGHPDIATTSEPWIALHPFYALRKQGIETHYNSKWAQFALLDFLKQSGIDENFYKKQVGSFLLSFYEKSIEYQKKKYFLDKTPRYYHVINELLDVFPQAKCLVLIRNPLAVLNSILKTWVKGDYSRLGEYKNDLMIGPMKLIECLKKHPDRSLKINYETLVEEPEENLEKICKFLGVSYSPTMINYSQRAEPGWNFGDPTGVFKENRPVLNSIESWRKGFKNREEKIIAVSYIHALGSKIINNMGYDYETFVSIAQEMEKDASKMLMSSDALKDQIDGFEKVKSLRKMMQTILLDPNTWEGYIDSAEKVDKRYDVGSLLKDATLTRFWEEQEKFHKSLAWKIFLFSKPVIGILWRLKERIKRYFSLGISRLKKIKFSADRFFGN